MIDKIELCHTILFICDSHQHKFVSLHDYLKLRVILPCKTNRHMILQGPMDFKEWFIHLFNQEMRVSTLFSEPFEDNNRQTSYLQAQVEI